MKDGDKFKIEEWDDFHIAGDENCPACWGEPEPCSCGGLVHLQWLDESYDAESGEEFIHIRRVCDRCEDEE